MARRFFNYLRSFPPHVPYALAVSLATVVWAYWTTLGEAAEQWANNPQYSHGYLVPGFALVLLWLRLDTLHPASFRPSWWGLGALAAAVGLRLAGTYYHFIWLDAISLLPCLAGLVLLIGGWAAWRWAWPGILFLGFMIPLPYRVGEAMADPLRRFATVTCTFVLQTLGLPAIAEGNRILMNEENLDIVGQCSGLRMLMIFFALATAVAMVVRRPLWEKLLIVASAIPIALVANVVRITATGLLYEWGGSALSHQGIHDWAGYSMMPLGLLLLLLEFTYLKHLMIQTDG